MASFERFGRRAWFRGEAVDGVVFVNDGVGEPETHVFLAGNPEPVVLTGDAPVADALNWLEGRKK